MHNIATEFKDHFAIHWLITAHFMFWFYKANDLDLGFKWYRELHLLCIMGGPYFIFLSLCYFVSWIISSNRIQKRRAIFYLLNLTSDICFSTLIATVWYNIPLSSWNSYVAFHSKVMVLVTWLLITVTEVRSASFELLLHAHHILQILLIFSSPEGYRLQFSNPCATHILCIRYGTVLANTAVLSLCVSIVCLPVRRAPRSVLLQHYIILFTELHKHI